jgi:hypothetical protein
MLTLFSRWTHPAARLGLRATIVAALAALAGSTMYAGTLVSTGRSDRSRAPAELDDRQHLAEP